MSLQDIGRTLGCSFRKVWSPKLPLAGSRATLHYTDLYRTPMPISHKDLRPSRKRELRSSWNSRCKRAAPHVLAHGSNFRDKVLDLIHQLCTFMPGALAYTYLHNTSRKCCN